MKSFASALLFAGANAAAAAIDFGVAGKVDIAASNKLNYAGRAVTDADSTVTGVLTGAMSATYTLATDVAAKQFSVTGVLKFQHKGAWVDKKSFFGMWQCFKNAASLDAKDMRCFAWQFTPTSGANGATNKGQFKTGFWKSKVPGTAHVKADVDVTTTAADQPITGTNAFAKGAMWTALYLCETASAGTVFTNAGSITPADATPVGGGSVVAYNATAVGLNAKPTIATAAWGTGGYDLTITWVYKPAADADNFYVNGKLYSAALYTMSQTSGLAYVGYKGCDETNCTTKYNYQELVSPTLTSTTAKIRNAGAGTTTTLAATPAFTSGTVTAAKAQLDMFSVSASTGELSIILTQSATLGAAVTSTATEVQQMSCFPVYTTAPKQYLCMMGVTTITAASLTSTQITTHQVWHANTALLTTSFATATNKLDAASASLNTAAQKAFKVYEAKSAAASPGEEALLASLTLPEPKFQWRNGNYLDFARTGVKTTIGFSGLSKAASNAQADATATITTIKTGVASAGFTATAATASTTAMLSSATTAFTAPTAATCDQSQAYCTKTYPTVCKTSGALSLAAVGASIAALAMAF